MVTRHRIASLALALAFQILMSGTAQPVLWTRTFSGAGSDLDQEATGLALDGAGDAIAVGRVYDHDVAWPFPANSHADLFATKVRGSDGAVLWQRMLGGVVPTDEYRDDGDDGLAVATSATGDAFVLGYLNTNSHADRLAALKLRASDGSVEWTARFSAGGSVRGVPQAITTDADGDVVVGLLARPDSAFAVAKLAATGGAVIWQSSVAGGSCRAVAVDADRNVIAVGGLGNEAAVIKLAAGDGAEIWRWRSAPDTWRLRAVAVDAASGDVVVAGRLGSGPSQGDFGVIKLGGEDGELVWSYVKDGTAAAEENLEGYTDEARSVAVDAQGNVLVTGEVNNTGGPPCGEWICNTDILVAKLDGSTGNAVWERELGGPATRSDIGAAIALDSTGDAVVAGSTAREVADEPGSYPSQFFVAKVGGATGGIVWLEELGSGHSSGAAAAVSIGGDDEPVAAGYLPGSRLFGVAKAGRQSRCNLKLARLDGSPERGELALAGELPLAHPFAPPVDPPQNGLRLRVEDGSGSPLLDAEIPGGVYDASARKGWRSNSKQTIWRYRDRSEAGAAITKLSLRDRSVAGRGGLIAFTAAGLSDYPIAPGDEALDITLTIDTAAGQRGGCHFNPSGSAPPSCQPGRDGDSLKCN